MKKFLLGFTVTCIICALTSTGALSAPYVLTGTKWEPGLDSAAINSPSTLGTPGGASWSIMAAGHDAPTLSGDFWHPAGAQSVAFAGMTGLSNVDPVTGAPVSVGGIPIEIWAVDWALDTWAAVSGFSNLGQVADGDNGVADNTAGGWNGNNALDADGGDLGDIRIAAYDYLGAVLADTYNPGTESDFGIYRNIGGDAHFAFDNDENFTWVNDPLHSLDPGDPIYINYTPNAYDFPTIILHEMGHALGLAHPTGVDAESNLVMAEYVNRRHAQRDFGDGDFEGIRAIYGPAQEVPPVPEPGTIILLGTGLIALAGFRKKLRRR